MTTIKLGYGTPEGNVTDRHIDFYVHRAQGAVGLITSEPMYIQANGREIPTQLGIYEDHEVLGGIWHIPSCKDEGYPLDKLLRHGARKRR